MSDNIISIIKGDDSILFEQYMNNKNYDVLVICIGMKIIEYNALKCFNLYLSNVLSDISFVINGLLVHDELLDIFKILITHVRFNYFYKKFREKNKKTYLHMVCMNGLHEKLKILIN